MSVVIAQRDLTIDIEGAEHAGSIRVFAPEADGDDWRCDFQIIWPGFERKRHTMGVDSYQALTLALKVIPAELEATEEFKAGRLRLFGATLSEPSSAPGDALLTLLETSFGLEPYRLASERHQ